MKNALLLVAVFLGGITTQLMGQDVVLTRNDHHDRLDRYDRLSKRSVQFVEKGILYTLYTDGRFSFKQAYQYRPRGGHGNRPNGRDIRIKTNRRGEIVKINGTRIHYRRNGKVVQIGRIPIDYHRGRVLMVGGLSIEYNRRGLIRRTYGYVNRYHRPIWQDDWYTYVDHSYGRNQTIDKVWDGPESMIKDK